MINVMLSVLVAGKEANPSKDGRTMYYKLGLVQGASVASVSTTQDVFDSVQPMKPYVLDGVINEYKGDTTFRIVGVRPDEPMRTVATEVPKKN